MTDHVQDHIDEIRAIVRTSPGYGSCGCESPRRHEPGCRHQLDPDCRVLLAAALALDGFRTPSWTVDEECQVLARIRSDADYARRLADWITQATA